MRTLFIVLACIAILLGLVLVVLPMGNIAIIPSIIGLLFAYISLKKSIPDDKKPPKILMIIASLLIIIGVTKHFFIKTEVAKDDSFEVRVKDSQKKAIEELDAIEEELEGL